MKHPKFVVTALVTLDVEADTLKTARKVIEEEKMHLDLFSAGMPHGYYRIKARPKFDIQTVRLVRPELDSKRKAKKK